MTSHPHAVPESKLVLCPYCGHTQPEADRCAECRGLFEPLSLKATQIAMGPWYIRDKANPFRPGCSYEVLRRQIEAGKVKPTTVLRGPTTRQFWSVARHVPGVAHLLGYCNRCGTHVQDSDVACPRCAEPFMAVRERNELGLQFPTAAQAQAAQRELDQARRGEREPATTPSLTPAAEHAPAKDDLYDTAVGVPSPAPGPDGGEALDFAPSHRDAAEPAPPAAHHSALVWVLVALNVVAALAVLALLWWAVG